MITTKSFAYKNTVQVQFERLHPGIDGTVREAYVRVPGEPPRRIPLALLDMTPKQAIELARVLLNAAARANASSEPAPPLPLAEPR